jgi:sterol desaturase/sphingolipid hydroxylase (fatty acid hydroxylase superfamily)
MSDRGSTFQTMLVVAGPFALIWSGVFVSHILRCILASGLTELAVQYVPVLRGRRLRRFNPGDAQRQREFRATLHTGGIFALEFALLVVLTFNGFTQLYLHQRPYGVVYDIVSFGLAVLIHDAYFYWTHRWMHRRSVFNRVHLDHHRSKFPTAWTAFSFHPLEAIVEGGIHVLLPILMPMNAAVLGAFIIWTNLYAALLHCGHDVFFVRGAGANTWRARWLNGPVEHEAHHSGYEGNYALYFTFWDRLMKTRLDPTRRRVSMVPHQANRGV